MPKDINLDFVLTAASIVATFGVAVVGYVAYRVWSISKWMRKEIREVAEATLDTNEYRDKIVNVVTETHDGNAFRESAARAVQPVLSKMIEEAVEKHENDSKAHTELVYSALDKHNSNPEAHSVARRNHPTMADFNGFAQRVTTEIQSLRDSISAQNVQRLADSAEIKDLLHREADERRKDLDRLEKNLTMLFTRQN